MSSAQQQGSPKLHINCSRPHCRQRQSWEILCVYGKWMVMNGLATMSSLNKYGTLIRWLSSSFDRLFFPHFPLRKMYWFSSLQSIQPNMCITPPSVKQTALHTVVHRSTTTDFPNNSSQKSLRLAGPTVKEILSHLQKYTFKY